MPQTEDEKKISAALEAVAGEVGNGATLTAVAVAWALAKAPYVFPVVGGRSPAQLDDVIKVSLPLNPYHNRAREADWSAQGLEIALTPAQVQALEAATPFVPGFPYNFFGGNPALGDGRPNYMVNAAGWVKWVKAEAPITPGP